MKKLKLFGLLLVSLLLMLSLAACGDNTDDGDKDKDNTPPAPTTVSVTGVTLSPKTLTMLAGETKTLTAAVAPSVATNRKLSWFSSNENIATITGTTLTVTINGIASGECVITVTSEDGGFSDTCAVTVALPAAEDIALHPSVLEIGRSASAANRTMKATVYPALASQQVVWSISNVEPAGSITINAGTGVIASTADGTATVTATCKDDNTLTASCSVKTRSGSSVKAGIASIGDFLVTRTNTSWSYEMLEDIDFGGENINRPLIADKNGVYSATEWSGIFDGKGHTLSNFKIRDFEGNLGGSNDFGESLFGAVSGNGIIRNLAVKDFSIETIGQNGVFAASNSGTIENCYIENGSIKVTNTFYDKYNGGGVLVAFNANGGRVRNCVVKSMTSTNTTGSIANFPLAIVNRVPQSSMDTCIFNLFMVTDNLGIQETWDNPEVRTSEGLGALTYNNCFLFKSADVGSQNFGLLSGDYWTLNAGGFPTLKVLN